MLKRMPSITTILFDVGGVLVRTEDRRPRRLLADSLGITAEALEEIVFSGDSGDAAQRGEVTAAQHWDYVRRVLALRDDEVVPFRDAFFGGDVLDRELVDIIAAWNPPYKTAIITNALDDARAGEAHGVPRVEGCPRGGSAPLATWGVDAPRFQPAKPVAITHRCAYGRKKLVIEGPHAHRHRGSFAPQSPVVHLLGEGLWVPFVASRVRNLATLNFRRLSKSVSSLACSAGNPAAASRALGPVRGRFTSSRRTSAATSSLPPP